jgi:hypothetical protein
VYDKRYEESYWLASSRPIWQSKWHLLAGEFDFLACSRLFAITSSEALKKAFESREPTIMAN